MYKAICVILPCLLLTGSMTACYDSAEIDSWSYVYTLGVDKGISEQFRYTLQVSAQKRTPEEGNDQKNSGKPGKGDFTVVSIDSPTLYEGVDLLNSSLTKTLNFMHTKFFIISEEVAKEGVESLVDSIGRTNQVRRIMHFIVVKGKASGFINEFEPVAGAAVAKTQESMISQQEETGLFDNVTYGDFIDDMKSTKIQPICTLAAINDFSHYLPGNGKPIETKGDRDYYAGEIPRTGGNKPEYLGMAIFNGDKMVGELTGNETRTMLMAKGEFIRADMTIPDPLEPEMDVTLDTRQQKRPDIKVTYRDGKPFIHLKVFLEGELRHIQSNINYESKKLSPVLEDSYKKYIKEKLDRTIQKCINLNCDVFGFGERASMQFLTIQEWEEYNWLDQFKDAKFATEVELVIKRPGTVMRGSSAKGAVQ